MFYFSEMQNTKLKERLSVSSTNHRTRVKGRKCNDSILHEFLCMYLASGYAPLLKFIPLSNVHADIFVTNLIPQRVPRKGKIIVYTKFFFSC